MDTTLDAGNQLLYTPRNIVHDIVRVLVCSRVKRVLEHVSALAGKNSSQECAGGMAPLLGRNVLGNTVHLVSIRSGAPFKYTHAICVFVSPYIKKKRGYDNGT